MSPAPVNSLRLVVAGILLSMNPGVFAQIEGMKTFENRKEGTNVHPNAAPDFALIAVHRNFEMFPRNAVLHVRFFLPPPAANATRTIFLEAFELQDSFHYFMQATGLDKWKDAGWKIFEPWPTKDVIDNLGLEPANLGVLAHYETDGAPKVYLPVDVYQNDSQSKAKPYSFHFITARDLQALDVSVANEKGVVFRLPRLQLTCNTKYNPDCKLYSAGSAQAFDLDMSMLQPGTYHVKLLGRIPGNLTPSSADFVVYHAR